MKSNFIFIGLFSFLLSGYSPLKNTSILSGLNEQKRSDFSSGVLLNSGHRWNIGTNSVSEWPIDPHNLWKTSYLTINGDTIINNTEYNLVYESPDTLFKTKTLKYYIREAPAGKIFLSNGEKEILVFDFSLNKGDTLIVDYFDTSAGKFFVRVDSTGTITLADNKQYKAQYVQVCDYYNKTARCNDYSVSDIWIPEIGSLKFGLMYPRLFVTGNNNMFHLLCHYANNKLLYVNPEFNNCEINTSVAGPAIKPKQLIDLYQLTGQSLQLRPYNNQSGTITIYDINGKTMIREKISGNKTLHLNNLPGLYLYRYITDKGEFQTGKIILK